MSTIASPRESSVNGRRPPVISTPTSSSRPSFENPRSSDPSPNRSSLPALPKRNRAALREYYNLKAAAGTPGTLTTPVIAIDNSDAASTTSSIHDNNSHSSVPDSILDSPSFSAPSYIKDVLETQSLGELLRTYNGVLTDIRALDAEKKALVYDNYSKLILATETIRKMRDRMDPLNPMAGTLDLAVRGVYERAEGLRGELRRSLGKDGERNEERRKVRGVVERVLGVPGRVRRLVGEGKNEEARVLWEETLVVLERWRERGVGGSDVQDCIDEGEVALKKDIVEEEEDDDDASIPEEVSNS